MYVFFVDGAVSGNPGGPGGWGVVMRTSEGRVEEFGAHEPETTNQRTELLAAIAAVERFANIVAFEELDDGVEVVVVSDSQYVVKGITEWIFNWLERGWHNASGKPVANQDLWGTLLDFVKEVPNEITWQHVRGHRGIPGNERADKIAVAFKQHREIDLYDGPYEKYGISLEIPKGKPA